MKHIVQLSGGKDSTAMLLLLTQMKMTKSLPYQIDEAVFFDTGMEFDAVYRNIDHLKVLCAFHNIKFTVLKPKMPFEFTMFEQPHKGKHDGIVRYGYSWCGGMCRWGTHEKLRTLEKYCEGAGELVGLAFDEPKRVEKERKGNKQFPLFEMGITESEALRICYKQGCYFEEDAGAGNIRLYDYLDRVSCWCCGNKNLKELRNMYLYMPKYWERLKELQRRTDRPFRRDGKTIFDLEERFKREIAGGKLK